jgi:TolB protein
MPPWGGATRLVADTGVPFLERFADSWKTFGTAPWFPSGRELLFSRLGLDGSLAVWKTDVTTGREMQLTFPPNDSDDLLASVSFDGEQVVFARRRSGKEGLWLISAHGGAPRVLLSDAFDNTIPSFSPDNRRVVFESDRAGPVNLWDIEIASGRLRRLTSGPGVDMNAVAGARGGLLFAHHSFDLNLYQLDMSTGEDHRLTSSNDWNYQPRISPSGDRVVYFSGRDGNFDLRLLEIQTNAERPLTNHPAADVAPDWSPDGREVAFVSNRGGVFQLWIVNVASGTVRRVLTTPVAATQGVSAGIGQTPAPRWSPDGRSVGFLTSTPSGYSLWRVDPDGQNARQLIDGISEFDWYRDSRHLIYSRAARDGSGLREMVVVDLVTGAATVVHKGLHAELAASPDGTAITYASGLSHFCRELFILRLVPPSSSDEVSHLKHAPKQLTAGNCAWHVHNGGWSRDGKTVVYMRERHEGDVYCIENYR